MTRGVRGHLYLGVGKRVQSRVSRFQPKKDREIQPGVDYIGRMKVNIGGSLVGKPGPSGLIRMKKACCM